MPLQGIIPRSLDVAVLNSDTVNVAEYSTFADAIADCPQGGTLYFPAGTYDVADYGRLVIDHTEGINVEAAEGDEADGFGAVIVNTGSDRVTSGPVVEIDGDATAKRTGITIVGLAVRNDASVTGISVTDAPETRLVRCRYAGLNNGQADTGILLSGESYSSQLEHCRVTADDTAMDLNHSGGEVNVVATAGTSRNGDGWHIRGNDVQVFGGNATAGSGIGMLVTGNSLACNAMRFEDCVTGVQFGDGMTAPGDGIVSQPTFGSIDDEMVRWKDSDRCRLLDIRLSTGSTNGLVVEANAADATIQLSDLNDSQRSFSNSGTRTTVKLDLNVESTTNRDTINVKAPGTTLWNGANLQVWDGASWVNAA